MDKPAILVSACLLGVPCNHKGEAAEQTVGEALSEHWHVVPVCPEVVGGLPTPRAAAEIQGERVVNVGGEDVTDAYRRGAETALALARSTGAARAVLKARSPSCGSAGVYDGTFTKTLTDGEGITVATLRAAGIEVSSEEDPLPVPGTVMPPGA